MRDKNDVEVLIDGRKYTIRGFESEEYMQHIASYINRKYADLRKKEYYTGLDMELRHVLMAINIADDYCKCKKKTSEYRTENELKDKSILDMKHEIIELQENIKKLETEKKKLETTLEQAEKKKIELETRLKQKR